MSPMGNTEMGTIRVINAADQPNQLIPDNYTGAGIKKYTKARKESLAKAWNSYVTETGNPNTDINSVKLTYIPREGQPIDIVVPPGDGVTEALAKTDAPINDDQPDNIPPADGGNPPKGPEPSQDNGENLIQILMQNHLNQILQKIMIQLMNYLHHQKLIQFLENSEIMNYLLQTKFCQEGLNLYLFTILLEIPMNSSQELFQVIILILKCTK